MSNMIYSIPVLTVINITAPTLTKPKFSNRDRSFLKEATTELAILVVEKRIRQVLRPLSVECIAGISSHGQTCNYQTGRQMGFQNLQNCEESISYLAC